MAFSERIIDSLTDEDVPLEDRSVRLLQKLTSRGDWRVPSEAFLDIPGRLYEYIKSIDIHEKPVQFERAVRLLARLHDQNLAHDRAEIRFYGPQAVSGPDTPDSNEASPRPQIAHQERPSLQDASATLKVLDDLGILGDIASGNAQRGDVLEGKAKPAD